MAEHAREVGVGLEAAGAFEARARPTRVRYLVLLAACALAVVTYIHRVGFSTASPAMRSELGLSQRDLGLLMAAFLIAYGVGEVPWGLIGDRKGVRDPLATIILGGSLCTAAVAAVVCMPVGWGWRLGFLLAVRLLFGAFQAGTFPSIARMLTDWMPTTERGGAQGLLWMSSRIGGAAAPLLLVPLFRWLGSWELALVLVACLGGLWCLAFWPWFRDRPEDLASVNAAERLLIARGRAVRPAGHGAVPWRRMLGSSSVWALCLMYGGLGYSGNFFLTLLPDYLKTQRALGPEAIRWMTSLPFAVGVGACLAGGTLSDWIIRRTGSPRWGRRAVGAAGMAIAAGAILAAPFVRSVPALGALLCLTFLGNDLAMGPSWAAAADLGERHAGTLGGLMNMTSSFAAGLAAIVTGHLFEVGDGTLPFVLFAAAYAIGVVCWLKVDVTRTLADAACSE